MNLGSKIKRLAIAAPVIAVATLGFAVTTSSHASAATPTPVACSFQGTTTSLSPAIPNGSAFAPTAAHPGASGEAPFTTASSGTYQFNGGPEGACAVGTSLVSSISSSGTYQNISCGTGAAYGSVTLDSVTVYYTIVFAGGNGTFYGSTTLGGTPTLTGTVHITASPTTGCVTGPATGFTVNGVVAGEV